MSIPTLGAAPTGSYIAQLLASYTFTNVFTVQASVTGAADSYGQQAITYGPPLTGQPGRFRDLTQQEVIDAQQTDAMRVTAWLDCPLATPVGPRARISAIQDRAGNVTDRSAWRVLNVNVRRGFGPEFQQCQIERIA